jgi:hypothetical protein
MTDQPTRSTPATHGEVVPESRAKQGNRGFHMLAVLVISIALLALIYLGIYFAHARPTSDTGAQDAAQRTAGATKTTP